MRDNPHVYTDMPSESAPPILVDSDGMIEDGQHRYESAKKRGDKKILAYVIK
jgi:ParB-like chromosome segregation protein Spo0J